MSKHDKSTPRIECAPPPASAVAWRLVSYRQDGKTVVAPKNHRHVIARTAYMAREALMEALPTSVSRQDIVVEIVQTRARRAV